MHCVCVQQLRCTPFHHKGCLQAGAPIRAPNPGPQHTTKVQSRQHEQMNKWTIDRLKSQFFLCPMAMEPNDNFELRHDPGSPAFQFLISSTSCRSQCAMCPRAPFLQCLQMRKVMASFIIDIHKLWRSHSQMLATTSTHLWPESSIRGRLDYSRTWQRILAKKHPDFLCSGIKAP